MGPDWGQNGPTLIRVERQGEEGVPGPGGDARKWWDRGVFELLVDEAEPMVDALIYEPIPYRSAASMGCTHVLVLRSYPDGRLLPRSPVPRLCAPSFFFLPRS